jgi:1,4-alpha-glucan branching enzyme
MGSLGSFTFVLHSHIPYCRRAGRWPHGEEWIHEAILDTYLPLLVALYRLAEEGVPFRLTISLTPVLAEQLKDSTVVQHFEVFAEDKILRAEKDIERFRARGDDRFEELARMYHSRYRELLAAFVGTFGRDLVAAFGRLQQEGYLELLTSAATHGYLPLLGRDSSIHGQLATGVRSYRRMLGVEPRSVWLPECGYRPAYWTSENEHVRPGLETFLAELGLRLFFVETHAIRGGTPVGKAMGDAVGPYGMIARRYVVPAQAFPEPTLRTTFRPYWVQSTEVAAIGRNERTGIQVWSAEHGYPGDFWYREFHKKDGVSGLQYWRVTGAEVGLGEKEPYSPAGARWRVEEHSQHFARLVVDELAAYNAETGDHGILAAVYDTELFGHWWYEGIDWMEKVLRVLASQQAVEMVTASQYLEAHPPVDVLALPESSWGQGGSHFTWMNADTAWMWPLVHGAERRLEALVDAVSEIDAAKPGLRQLCRELLLLQSSDWPFLITTGQAAEYAVERFQTHLDRFVLLASLLEAGEFERAALRADEIYELDKIFPDIDPEDFRRREP